MILTVTHGAGRFISNTHSHLFKSGLRLARLNSYHVFRPSLRPAVRSSSAPRLISPYSTTPLGMSASAGFYSLKATLPGNKEYDFAQLKGKVVLIVNTASAWCAFPFTH